MDYKTLLIVGGIIAALIIIGLVMFSFGRMITRWTDWDYDLLRNAHPAIQREIAEEKRKNHSKK